MRTIKWLGTTILLLIFSNTVFSQQLLLGKNPYALQKSAVLELNSDNQGLLFPRLADTASINLLSPPDGMVIFFTPSRQLMIRSNAAWQALTPATALSNYWSINGNTNGTAKKIGTTDNYELPFITNNLERLRISAAGNVGIANTNPSEKLDVTGNIRFSGALMPGGAAGALGNILVSSGSGAAPTWQDASSYMASNAWMQNGNNFTALKNFGTTSNFALPFITNNVERMRLTTSGFLGIGTTAPSTALHVKGTNPLTLEGVQTGTATSADSVLTISSGLVKKLPVLSFQSQLSGTGFIKATGTTISYDNNSYTVANAAITGATKTKITYDSKGLVTGGADATTSDIAEGSNLYYTDARVRNATLTGLSTTTATPVTATDNLLAGVGKLQGQINSITGAGYLTGNQTVTLSGDITGSGTTAITTSIGANKVTLGHMAQVANGTFLGRTAAATGNVEALTTAQAKSMLGLTGTNSGDVTVGGQNYLSLSGQTITAGAIDLSGTHATGTLAAARFGALTGDVTNTAGSYATTIANGAVTYAKMQNVSTNNRLLGRATTGAGSVEEITIGSGLTLTGSTLSATASANQWNTTGNSGINASLNFLGTTDDKPMILKSYNQSFLEFGNRGTLGLTQSYTDYNDPLEKVTHIRSAMQFEAPAANFYKPKMYIDANGNFRIKGSSAGTDYFEMGSTGTSNNGGFEFIIGDDGDEPIVFKSYHYINGMSEIMRLQSGRMAVGSNAFDATNPEKLLIDAGTTDSYNLMTGKGSIDNYLQINVQNRSGGASASSDLVATANNGSETDKFIDMGINSGGYTNTTYPILGGANTTYLYGTGNDFVLGNGTAAKNLRLFTGGFANTNERLRIDGSGNVGINNTSPSEKLDITGNLRFSGAFMPGGLAGTAGQILQSNGANAAPTWVTASSAATSWSLSGNSVSSLQKLGTTTNFDLPIITNNTEAMRITTANRVGINTSSPTEILDVNGNIKISGGNKRLLFKTPGADPDAVIEHRTYTGTESNELLFYVGNDNSNTYGPDRIRMAAEEFRVQTFNSDINSSLANAESETNINTRLIVNEEGNVGVGSEDFDADAKEKLLVDAGSTDSYNLIVGKGDINNYLQLNIQNNNNGNLASSDIVATANNGSEGSVYIDMGINSQGYSSGNSSILNGSNTAYLYATGNHFYIGNGSTNKDLRFFTNTGTTGADGNERMRITGSTGNVSIGTTSNATEKLVVAGNAIPSANNSYTLGNSTYRWSQVYASNGIINTSDGRVKTNIKNLGYGLKEVLNMQPVSYNWKDTAHKENKIGLIAQDVKKIVPEVVIGDESKEILGLNYAELVPVLINAIKEQQKQIEELKGQHQKDQASLKDVDELKQQLKELSDRVKQIEKH